MIRRLPSRPFSVVIAVWLALFPALAFADMKEMQTMLAHAGYDVGKIDGFAGLKTRQAVKEMQKKYGLPADSYPTAELLAHMRGGR